MLTLVLPVRNWSAERIQASVQSFLALNSTALTEILVIDFGSEEPVAQPVDDERVKLVRLEADVWSLSEAINAGVLLASNDLIAKTDADILVDPRATAAFDSMVQGLAKKEFGLGLCQAIDLHQTLSVEAAAAAVASGQNLIGRLRPKWGQGGLVFFRRDTWNNIGGFDSRFTGWGNEDNDFAERIRRSGHRIHWSARDSLKIFHVWHPPSHAATGVLSHRQANQKIASKDKSVLRGIAFRHSNFAELASPAVWRNAAPNITLGIATTARPDRDRMIKEAIDSFRGQAGNDFEVLVLENGSPADETETLRQTLKSIEWTSRIRLETTDVSSIPHARNLITDLAEGRYICVVDDDDIALANRLDDHLAVMEGNGMLHGSHGGWIDFDETTGVIERNSGKHRDAATLLRGTGKITAHPASFYRKDVMKAVRYDEAFALGSDLDLALRMAALGFEIGHTNTFVTLRRYHSSNVTITGTANQVSNGATARARALSTYAWNKQAGLTEAAKQKDKDAYCRNQMSFDTIADLLPGYVGEWQIYAPLEALQDRTAPESSAEAVSEATSDQALLEHHPAESTLIAQELAAPGADSPSDRNMLDKVLDLIDGDLATRKGGLNQPIYFRSVPIQGLEAARQQRQALEALIGIPCEISSVRQGEIDRAMPFDWRKLDVQAGERVLRSAPFSDLSEAFAARATLPQDSLMAALLSIVSDFDEGKEVYYLVTPSVRGHDELRQFSHQLVQQLSIPFHQITATGEASELTLNSRAH